MSFSIRGTGMALPAYILDNETLSTMVDTSDEWIQTRTGIRSRHICTTESMEDLAASAGERALSQAGIEPEALDLILCATVQGDYITPSLACMVQKRLGATCPAMDINAACTGFLYALDVAASYFARGNVRHVLVIAAECMSKHVDWTDRATCVLFGDGAGAVVLGPGEGLRAVHLVADGNADFLNIPGSTNRPPMAPPYTGRTSVFMQGQAVYRFAVKAMCEGIQTVLRAAGISMADVRFVLAHQANRRILDAAQMRLDIPPEKMVYAVDRLGNISSATIPIMLDEVNRQGELRQGDYLVMCAFGGGLTAGAMVLQWG